MVSCGSGNDRGELVGVKGGQWKQPKPYGMTLVPGGAFVMGSSDYDKAHTEDATTKTVTVSPFYMDDTEITNGEYRQFVNWVRDSIVRRKLAIMAEESGQSAGGEGIGQYASLILIRKNSMLMISICTKIMEIRTILKNVRSIVK